jgi:hypothetical protein
MNDADLVRMAVQTSWDATFAEREGDSIERS